MTQAEATAEATKLWGAAGFAEKVRAKSRYGRYVVGVVFPVSRSQSRLQVLGNGSDWESAFKTAGQTVKLKPELLVPPKPPPELPTDLPEGIVPIKVDPEAKRGPRCYFCEAPRPQVVLIGDDVQRRWLSAVEKDTGIRRYVCPVCAPGLACDACGANPFAGEAHRDSCSTVRPLAAEAVR